MTRKKAWTPLVWSVEFRTHHPRHSTFGQSCGAQLLVRKRCAFYMLFTFLYVQALRKVEEQRRTVIWNYKEPSVLVLDYFKIRGSPVLVLWQHIRMNELLVLVISKTLKDQWFLWKKWQSTDGFYERISNELMVFYERIGNELMDLWLVGQVLGALPNIMWNSIVACTLTYQYSALQKGQ
jgi:hypothetical protein